MEDDAYQPYREEIRSQLAFALLLGAVAVPLFQLDNQADPLVATSWYTSTLHSGGLAFVLALVYAAATYLWLRPHAGKPAYLWYALGAVTGLVPGLMYVFALPERAFQEPIILVLGAGIVSGAFLSGPAYLILRSSRIRTHVA
jgi:hypothetical protein